MIKIKFISLILCLIAILTFIVTYTPKANAIADEGWLWPIHSDDNIYQISSPMQEKRLIDNKIKPHYGIDIPHTKSVANPHVIATRSGKVVGINDKDINGNSYGIFVTIEHDVDGKKMYSSYAHLKYNSIDKNVILNKDIAQGQYIGLADSTGKSYGAHLHFAVSTSTSTLVLANGNKAKFAKQSEKDSQNVNPADTSKIKAADVYSNIATAVFPDGRSKYIGQEVWKKPGINYIFEIQQSTPIASPTPTATPALKPKRFTTLNATEDEPTTDMLEKEGWRWDNNTKTLTIDGLNIETDAGQGIYIDASATIVIHGINSIINRYTTEDGYTLSGIQTTYQSGNLVFEGDGTLDVICDSPSSNNGIYSLVGLITINGGNITTTSESSAYGSCCGLYSHGLIMNGGNLTATAGASHGEDWLHGSRGIDVRGNIEINGGSLIASGGSSFNDNPTATAALNIYPSGEIILSDNVNFVNPSDAKIVYIQSIFDAPIRTVISLKNPDIAAKTVEIK